MSQLTQTHSVNYYKLKCGYVDKPVAVLQSFVNDQGHLYDNPVRWAEITILYLQLNIKLKEAEADQPVLLDVGANAPSGMIPLELPQLAYHLFVYCDLDVIYVVGLLERESYQDIVDHNGYALLGDINGFEWERPNASYVFQLDEGYYDDPDGSDFSQEAQHLATEVFFGRIAKIRDKELGLPYKTELEQMRVGFSYTKILASIDPQITELFENVELELLWDRLRLLKNHLDRARFAVGWFPDLLKVVVPQEPRHGLRYQNKPTTTYGQVFAFYRAHYLTPDPCVLYEGSAEYLTEVVIPQCVLCSRYDCPRLPVVNGRVTFGHMELSQFLTNRFRKLINMGASWAHTIVGTVYAQQFWFSDDPYRQLIASYKRVGVKPEQHQQSLRNLIRATAAQLEKMSEDDRWMIEEFAKPYIDEIKENIQDLLPKPPVMFNHQNNAGLAAVELENDQLPQFYEDLIMYAEAQWPPCLTNMVKSCSGFSHLKHPNRRRVSALLKAFGYQMDTAQRLFYLMFSQTRVEGLSSLHDFLNGKRGNIIANDYGSNKTMNLGISCRSMIGAGWCEFTKNIDMEDMGKAACSQNMNTLRIAEGKPSRDLYPISSPRSYFVQRRK